MAVATHGEQLSGVTLGIARAVQDSGLVTVTSRSGTAQVAEAITGGRMDVTVQGASTLTIDLLDPDRTLVTSPIAREETTVRWAGWTWALVRVSRQSDQVSLTFEPAVVVALRGKKGARKARQGTVTRIDFMRGLCKDAKVPVWVPPLDRSGLSKTVRPAAATPKRVQPGFSRGAKFKVKRKPPDGEQRVVAAQVLDMAWTVTAGRPAQVRERALVMTVMAATQESSIRNLRGGHADSQGVFQQRPSSGYKHIRDVPLATKDFLTWAPGRPAALAVMVRNAGRSLGWCISEAQRDESYRNRKGKQGSAYDQWAKESLATVRQWLGSASLTDQARGGLVSRKDAWERAADESSWDAMTRLCEEIQLRCFEQDGRIVISDDATLQAMAPDVLIGPTEGWVTDVAFDYDIGLPVAQARVTGTLAAGQLVQGRAVDVRGYGAADGRWIVETATSNLFNDDVDVTLTRPKPVLPEPVAESVGDQSMRVLGDGSGGAADEAEAWSKKQVGKPYVWGGGHGGWSYNLKGYDCSGFASHAAKKAGSSISSPGSTMTLFPQCKNRPAGKDAPVAFGFRGMQSGNPRTQHMGIRLNGRWYSAGGRGNKTIVVGDANWDHVVIPPGL